MVRAIYCPNPSWQDNMASLRLSMLQGLYNKTKGIHLSHSYRHSFGLFFSACLQNGKEGKDNRKDNN